MKRDAPEIDEAIGDRITMEIVVDAYHEAERAMGWYYYLQDHIIFPFKAKCIQSVSSSPLSLNEVVTVIGMDDEENCEHDMLVAINWKKRELCVSLKQLTGIKVDDETEQALPDWSYWVSQGYCF